MNKKNIYLLPTMPPIRTPTNNTFCFQGRGALLTYSRIGNFFVGNDLTIALIPHIVCIVTDDFQWKWAIEKHDDEPQKTMTWKREAGMCTLSLTWGSVAQREDRSSISRVFIQTLRIAEERYNGRTHFDI